MAYWLFTPPSFGVSWITKKLLSSEAVLDIADKQFVEGLLFQPSDNSFSVTGEAWEEGKNKPEVLQIEIQEHFRRVFTNTFHSDTSL